MLGLSLCLFLALDDEGFRILLFDRSGLYPVRDFERSLSRALKQGVQAKPKTSPPVVEIPFVERYYLPMLTYRRCALEGFAVSIGSDNAPSRLLTRAVLSLGGRIGPHGGLRCSLSDDGFLLSVEQDGCRLDDWHSKALLLKYLIRGRVALPASSPEALRDLCRERCLIYTHCPSGQEEAEARAASVWHPELRHGAAAALELIGLLTVSGRSLRELSRHLPHFATRTADVLTERAGRLGILPFLGDPDGDGIVAGYARGNVRVIASRTGFRLMAEAVSGEYAEEILELSEKEINRLLKEGAKKAPPR